MTDTIMPPKKIVRIKKHYEAGELHGEKLQIESTDYDECEPGDPNGRSRHTGRAKKIQ
jgi:hypothetical protein